MDAELLKVKDPGDRRWFVNGQGQTYAVIEGPVEVRMGSPPSEPDHGEDEIPHRRVIPRRFAIAAKEVTVEQFQRFLKLTASQSTGTSFRQRPQQVQSRSRRAVDRSRLVHGGSLLQLAERARGAAQGSVVLPACRGRGLHRGDDRSRPTCCKQRLSAADRGGMGICLPVRYDDQPLLWSLDRASRDLCPLSGQ